MSEAVIIAIIVAIPPTLAAIATLVASRRQLKELHVKINSRVDELVAAATLAGRAEGVAAEKKRNEDMP